MARVKYGDSWYRMSSDAGWITTRVKTFADQGKVVWFTATPEGTSTEVQLVFGAGIPLVVADD